MTNFFNNKFEIHFLTADNLNSGGCNPNVVVQNYHWKNTFPWNPLHRNNFTISGSIEVNQSFFGGRNVVQLRIIIIMIFNILASFYGIYWDFLYTALNCIRFISIISYRLDEKGLNEIVVLSWAIFKSKKSKSLHRKLQLEYCGFILNDSLVVLTGTISYFPFLAIPFTMHANIHIKKYRYCFELYSIHFDEEILPARFLSKTVL